MGGVHRGHAFSENAGSMRRAYLCLPHNRIFHVPEAACLSGKSGTE